ncbi:uncharacterized protein B0H18DRAFT_1195558 [Fomitopsis serialis]|uniref:uncharacterized protein n=1 Tax=Fomitopsis serialis TaxID=139415 RepID=UPI002007A4F1|nr:uncharacterized protein B0H18DRAFT_1195558 [Neoantrodia serialis]KAH9919519.1 hypothetical protein B0H18DRAFT_1195558 [Neoantrodia serialis]
MLVLRLVIVATIVSGVAADWLTSFKHRLTSISDAHNALFHDRLLGQLRSARASASPSPSSPAPTPSTVTSLHLHILDTTLSNATSPYADNSTTSFVLYTSDALPTNPAPPSACADSLTAAIQCNSTVPLMRYAAIASCCLLLTRPRAYELQCLYDASDAQYCGPVVNGYNATGGLLSLPSSELCTFCTLETLNITDLLSEAVQQCGSAYDSYNVTVAPSEVVSAAPTATFGVTGPPPMSATCAYTGQNVTISTNTTCAALGTQYQVSTNDIRSSNPGLVDSTCAITAPATLCIPPACNLYTVQTNDTCDSVAAASGSLTGTNVTTVQLISINPELGTYCQSISALVGDTICLSPNGGWPAVGVTTTALPSPTPTAVAPVPMPTGPGSTPNCGRWYLTKEGKLMSFSAIIIANGITLADFLTINPEINADCTNLWLAYYYCVAPYPPLASSTAPPIPTGNFSNGGMNHDPLPTANYTPIWYTMTLDPVGVAVPTNVANGTRTLECGYYYDVQSNDTLDSISSEVGLNVSVLETWNPQLANAAPIANTSICVVFPTGNYTLYNATRPSNADPKSTPDCAEWYTVVAGDGCASIEAEFGLTSDQFLELNPGAGADCTTLQLGVSYCVLSIYLPSSTTTGPPSNLAAGSFTNCTSYATVVSGDTCSTLEVAANISFTDLLRWNPELDTACETIELNAAYCVGGGGLMFHEPHKIRSTDQTSQVTPVPSSTLSLPATTVVSLRRTKGSLRLSCRTSTPG